MKVFDVTAQNGVTVASGLTLREANALALRVGGHVRPRVIELPLVAR
jgi:hypothetical protein